MALTEAQQRRRSSAAAYYPDSAAAAMAGGDDATPMSTRLHSDEAAQAPVSSGLHHSASEVKNGGVPAPAPVPRPQPNSWDGGLSPHRGGDRQGGDEFRSGGSGRGNPGQHFPFRGRGRRGRNTRGGRRGFHLPALSSKPAQDMELSREPAAMKDAAPAEVQHATPAEVQQATPATMALSSKPAQGVELLREPAALKEAAPDEVQQATLAEVQKATPATMTLSSKPAKDVELSRQPAALKATAAVEVQQATLAGVQKATPATMATPDGRYVWCDICRVNCSSLVNLETHKNGKRHQKIKLGLERFEAHQKLVSEVPPEKLIVETDNGNRGIKRKKPSEPVRVCTLCNTICETTFTFKAHLSGKKHMARIKRQKGPDMEYGCVPVPISSDQPAAGAGTTEAAENIFFGLARCDMLLQQGNGYDGIVAEISPHQQDVESVQV